ncbi:succinyldiaminopimelate aminotransferase apoenzyme [Nitrosospira multiformis ATCC 25196]|uniref:Succinyldiaminopimelate aminotransferase apoenzyme n=1 Tax=Nitrosospira multiformis (strain ATCC 25196 / NCIMB 11849 / C 71) TaxID=323848 RepID=Q2Y7X6_NITMU|nr:succinyldiaminopimelate transaminase [Nitrosospira multiformis]ABB75145.1 succinyldiaminopimelate aminotransferase apoenzyme [Nitrosospira multiformis ATCC 25196]SEF62005.1 succinyldiaminopimelate aminotransferase apoenzyme [Nitrosospira multiformis ATCC 25196]
MNPNLNRLQPYPFEKLTKLFEGIEPASAFTPISLHIGEPKHSTPDFIRQALMENLVKMAHYPATLGARSLRASIGKWLMQRYGLPAIDPDTEILPVNGSREALFSFAQAVIDSSKPGAIVICPNPFYQIYEGAALLAGATPSFLNTLPENDFSLDYAQLPDEVWSRTQLVYVCSPGNPTGRVMSMDEWRHLFELSDRYGFVIASDECYSEIYFDEASPPLGALQAAHRLGREGFSRLVVFSSLSKRSNVPGMRSGFVAGDAAILKKFLLYRTYHGSAMNPAVQAASEEAWNDEVHVVENRRLYREKFKAVIKLLQGALSVSLPDAAFYLWLKVPVNDVEFARQLYRDYNVTVLPGSYLARHAHGINPGENFVRIALVASVMECAAATERIKKLVSRL